MAMSLWSKWNRKWLVRMSIMTKLTRLWCRGLYHACMLSSVKLFRNKNILLILFCFTYIYTAMNFNRHNQRFLLHVRNVYVFIQCNVYNHIVKIVKSSCVHDIYDIKFYIHLIYIDVNCLYLLIMILLPGMSQNLSSAVLLFVFLRKRVNF